MKKILIVSPVECYPSHFGNSARIASFVNYLKDVGHDFKYLHLPDRAFDPQPMVDALESHYIYRPYKPRRRVIHKLRYRAVQSLLMQRSYRLVKVDDFLQHTDIVLYKRVVQEYKPDIVFINYTYYSKLFLYTPATVEKILDTHDSLYLRFNSIYNQGKSMNRFRINISDEINALNRADKVVCIQLQEEEFFARHGCRSQLCIIGHTIHYRQTAIHSKRFRLLYIGASYTANEHAIIQFLLEVWPILYEKYPTIELYIAGSIGETVSNKMSIPKNVKILGMINNLQGLYEEIDIAINPIQMGSGLKIKNIEALSYGKPVVTTALGAEGLSMFIDKGLSVVHNTEDWVNVILSLLDTHYYQASIDLIKEELFRYNNCNRKEMERLFN
ncbi:MAG TPA: glycosyltransferase [Pseudosphingobacterium sp.]|nr:glycosyltransferase [Pseudosphingobacterium sp.]